jgi:hypothetical protein
MGTLQERLDAIKADFLEKVPTPAKEVMDRATRDLRDSGILSLLPSAGTPLPAFELLDTDGNLVSSSNLLGERPLVVSFYRGLW